MKGLEHFSHDSDAASHPKMEFLRNTYGWAGYGMFWALNELIAREESGELDVSRPFARFAIAKRFGFTDEELLEFIRFLAEDAELIEYDGGIITTGRVQEDLGRVNASRERRARWKAKRHGGDPAPGPAPEPPRRARKAKDKPAEEKTTSASPEAPLARQEPAVEPPGRQEEAEAGLSIVPVTSAAPARAPGPKSDPVFQWLWDGFLGANGDKFSNYAKETRGCKELARLARAYAPAEPQRFLKELMATFKTLKGSDRFYASQPFLPSVLAASGIFDRLVEAMRQKEGATIDAWVPDEAPAEAMA